MIEHFQNAMIIQKLKAVFLFLLNLIKKSLCCLRRRRKSSADVVPLTDVGVVSNFHTQHGNSQGDDIVNWNNWEDPSKPKPPQTIEEHIQYYRNQMMGKQAEPTTPEEPQVDFFQDMTPAIKKQTKIVMRPKESTPHNRLAFNPSSDVVLPDDSGELKSWEETENREGFWADSGDWNTDEILRAKRMEEKRRKMLEKEHQRRGTVT